MGFQKHFRERLGFLPEKATGSLKGHPTVWIHGASLGEVRVARAIIASLHETLPGCAIVVSTVTEHGRALALKTFDKKIPVVYAPLDLPGCALRALSSVRPDVMVFLETEIWPVWILTTRGLGIRLALLNGRISPRSFKNYMKFKPFFRPVLQCFDAFSMISKADADRIHAMGAPPGKIRINGNAKYDSSMISPDFSVKQKIQETFKLTPGTPVIVAGSTREGEEKMLLNAYEGVLEKYSDAVLILAPRHIKRTPEICELIGSRGHACHLRTDIGPGKRERTAKILVIDTFGELFNIYSVATLVFCGASLVPLGGQNPLEPAVWGKPILYGPHMEDFLDAKEMLESKGGSVRVSGPQDLGQAFLHLLDHPEKAHAVGRHARETAVQMQAAAHKHADVIKSLQLSVVSNQ